MVSNFALLLSQDGIRLAHRTAEGWQEVGRVSLTAEDMAAELQALRKAGEARQGGAFSTKIVLPEDQIKYLSLPAPADDAERTETIHAALERATPYRVEELAFDWEESEDGLNIAVVARDTLAEAEQFAVQFGFNPLGFVASPDDTQFSVEPFFGPTEAAEHILGKGGEVEAELDKVVLSAPAAAPPEPVQDWDDPAPEADPGPDYEPDPDPEPEETPETSVSESVALARSLRAEREVDAGAAPRIGPAAGAPSGFVGGKRALDDPDLADKRLPGWAPPLTAEKPLSLEEDIDTQSIGWLHRPDTDETADGPPAWMGDSETQSDSGHTPAPSWIPDADKPQAPTAYERRAAGDPFPDPEPQRDRRLILAVLVLLLFGLAGGIYAARGWVFGPSEPQITDPVEPASAPLLQSDMAEIADSAPAEPDPAVVTSDGDAAPALPEVPTLPEASDSAEPAPIPETEPPLIRPAPELQSEVAEVAPADPPEEGVSLSAQPAEADAEPALAAAPTLPEAASDPEVPLATITAPPVLRPTTEEDAAELAFEPEAAATDPLGIGIKDEISYAASGIWPFAPAAPQAPASGATGNLYMTARDPDLRVTDAVALPSEAAMGPDQALATVPNPPPLGQSFARDARGLVQATPEGALTPDGVLVFAGPPPVVPPLAPDRAAQTQAANPQQLALAGRAPQFRPAEVEAAFADPALQGKIPRLRPAAIVERAEQEQLLADNPLALTATPAPRLRPANMAAIVSATERAEIAAQTARPTAPSATSAARAATQADAIPLRDINLIGVYGSAGNRRALIRQANGRFQMVVVGDQVDGGTVTAIEGDKLYYTKRGTSYVLEIPGN